MGNRLILRPSSKRSNAIATTSSCRGCASTSDSISAVKSFLPSPTVAPATTALLDLPDDYTLDRLRAALAYVKRFRVAVDGGAHRGIWTRELSKRFKAVIAFEPNEQMALKIGVGFVHYVALGESPGECGMADGDKNTGQRHLVAGAGTLIRALDAFQIRDLDFLKLDLEGYELPALKGAARTIDECRPAIMVEQNGLCERYGYTMLALVDWLKRRGYRRVDSWGVDVLYLPK